MGLRPGNTCIQGQMTVCSEVNSMEVSEAMAVDGDTQDQMLQKTYAFEQQGSAKHHNPDREAKPPPGLMEENQEEFVVERLLRERLLDDGELEIEVKWKYWADQHNTWQPRIQLLLDVPQMVADFDSRVRQEDHKSSREHRPALTSRDSKMSLRALTTGDVVMATPDSTPYQPSKAISGNWEGWAELENDPLIFSTLLREWGVQGVRVREVIPLDAVFDTPAESTLGLIFLSRYIVFDQGSDETLPSNKLWFANQISSYSCATVALMNIINNRESVSLGNALQTFKDRTISLSPKAKGLALDGLGSVRDVHNSFATENDKLNVDTRLKEEAKTAAAKKRALNRKKGRKGRQKAKTDTDDESGLHFVAFVPALGQMWRLDGLEREPTSIGRIENAGNWLKMVVPVLEAQFNAAAMNELEFSLLSVVLSDPSADDEKDQERMRRVREDWGPMMATLVRLHAEKGDIAALLG